ATCTRSSRPPAELRRQPPARSLFGAATAVVVVGTGRDAGERSRRGAHVVAGHVAPRHLVPAGRGAIAHGVVPDAVAVIVAAVRGVPADAGLHVADGRAPAAHAQRTVQL